MILFLSEYLVKIDSFFNVFNYLSVRAIMAVLTSLLICMVFGKKVIEGLKINNMGENVRLDVPQHLHKNNTPTMGGLLIVISIAVSIIIWGDWSNRFLPIAMATLLGFALIGLFDDYKKMSSDNQKGISAMLKYSLQSVLAIAIAAYLYYNHQLPAEMHFYVPFFKEVAIALSPIAYIIIAYLVIVGSSNSVNLTDGLDGLAILPTVLIGGALGLVAYLTGHSIFADYLNIAFIPGSGELLILCCTIVGSGLGFLWFNTYPAQVFMGDTGAIALGALLGIVAIITRHEIVFFIMAGIFVIETISVILQVLSFKLTGNRIFRMAPLHHHYEMKGWPEPRVIVRFWIITVILVLVALSTLKFR